MCAVAQMGRTRRIVDCAVALVFLTTACEIENDGIDPPPDELIYPVGLAVDPEADALYVANANFDLRYNGGTVVAIDLARVDDHLGEDIVQAEDVIDGGSTVRIGTFAADLAMAPEGDRLFVPVRGDNSVTWIDVLPGGGRRLRCWDGVRGQSAPPCSGDHVIGSGENAVGLRLPSEPFAIAFVDDYAVVTHSSAGEISLIAGVSSRPELVDIQGDLPAAASGVAVHPLTRRVYVSHRGAQVVSTLDIYDGSAIDAAEAENRPAIIPRRSVAIDVVSPGSDARSIAFHPDGTQAYLTSRNPRALLELDTSLGDDGAPREEWHDAIALADGPSRLVVHEESDGRVLIYVVCFDDGLVYAIDPATRQVDGILRTGEGPHAIAFEPRRAWIFVADFVTSTIEVFDGDPSHAEYRQRLFRIGVPKEPQGADA